MHISSLLCKQQTMYMLGGVTDQIYCIYNYIYIYNVYIKVRNILAGHGCTQQTIIIYTKAGHAQGKASEA